jgi:hypothetical protein
MARERLNARYHTQSRKGRRENQGTQRRKARQEKRKVGQPVQPWVIHGLRLTLFSLGMNSQASKLKLPEAVSQPYTTNRRRWDHSPHTSFLSPGQLFLPSPLVGPLWEKVVLASLEPGEAEKRSLRLCERYFTCAREVLGIAPDPPPTKKTPGFLPEPSVGARGFEPPTSCTPCKRASRAAPRPDCSLFEQANYSAFAIFWQPFAPYYFG